MPFWYWAAIGAVLGVIEVAIPAMVCIWLATAALGVAALAWRYPGLALGASGAAGRGGRGAR
jgi:membrane protein implicated in regulation of membrane protease activity